MTKWQTWARENYRALMPIPDEWHPDIVAECSAMNMEELDRQRAIEEEVQKSRQRIKEVVLSVDDLEKEFEGCISFRFGFRGSLKESRPITPIELAKLLESIPDEAKRKEVMSEFKGSKRLFSKKKFAEWEALKKQRTKWSQQIKNFGIPFVLDGMTVVKIALIPQIEKLCDKIEEGHEKLFLAMEKAYPSAITADAVDSLLYDIADYRPVETLDGTFGVVRKWLHFGVPEVLKEIDMARWEAERQRTAAVWQEIKQGGELLLREEALKVIMQFLEMLNPAGEGEQKRFFKSAVNNVTAFLDALAARNIAGDVELDTAAGELRSLLEGKTIESFKNDESLRDATRAQAVGIASKFEAMVVKSSARVIKLDD